MKKVRCKKCGREFSLEELIEEAVQFNPEPGFAIVGGEIKACEKCRHEEAMKINEKVMKKYDEAFRRLAEDD